MKKKLNPYLSGGIFFGIFMTWHFALQSGIVWGMCLGASGGILFGFLTWIVAKIYEKRQLKKLSSFRAKFAQSHDIVYESVATCFVRGVATEGRLFLTPKGLFFKSPYAKADTSELWIHFGFIKSLSIQEHSGSIGEGLIVKQEDRRQIKFVVPDADIWLRKMQPFVH